MGSDGTDAGAPVKLSDDQFDDFVGSNDVVLIDFWAPWCGPCKRVEPVIDELASEMDQVAFGKVNTDENPKTPQKFGVMSIPTLLIMKEGSVVDQIVGAQPKGEIKGRLEKALS